MKKYHTFGKDEKKMQKIMNAASDRERYKMSWILGTNAKWYHHETLNDSVTQNLSILSHGSMSVTLRQVFGEAHYSLETNF